MAEKSTSLIRVRTSPIVNDPKELSTILLLSLKELWGEFESHSHHIRVYSDSNGENKEDSAFNIECASDSVEPVRAALTWPTLPAYMDESMYRFDTISVSKGNSISR
jgi:hypothetical protein